MHGRSQLKLTVSTAIINDSEKICDMALRTATKFSTTVLRTYRCRRCVSNGMILPAQSMMNGRYGRGYATSDPKNKKFDIPDEYTEEVFQALANNPPVMQAMHNVIESLNKRGIKLDREPNVTEMWKIMKDKDVMNALTERTWTLSRF